MHNTSKTKHQLDVMAQLNTLCTLLFLVVHSATAATLDLVSIAGNQKRGTCLSQESRGEALHNIREAIMETTMMNLTSSLNFNCGAGLWYRVAHLNMSNSSQQCPSAWREYNITGEVRGCGRPETLNGNCPASFYPTGRRYSRVCGRIVGYQYGTPDAFGLDAVNHTIDSYYVYGVSVTHGTPRNHVWTFAAGLSEGGFSQQFNCPCVNFSHPDSSFPPSFVGNNYYCESGNPTDTFTYNHLYSTDPLWDGQQCEGECCSNGKSPPWFSVALANPTTNDIEVRICIAEKSLDDVVIQLLELYVQ